MNIDYVRKAQSRDMNDRDSAHKVSDWLTR